MARDPEPGAVTLLFDIDPAAAPLLLRDAELRTARQGRARHQASDIVWHDTPRGDLASRNLALERGRRDHTALWRLVALRPDKARCWPACAPAPCLAEADTLNGLEPALKPRFAEALAPVAAFSGRITSIALLLDNEPASLHVRQGVLRGVTQSQPMAQLSLHGAAATMQALTERLGARCRLDIPSAGLAARALIEAGRLTPAPRHLGAPILAPEMDVASALRAITTHLGDVILYWAGVIAHDAGAAPGATEPVHQIRVAVRRLRAALSLFRAAAADADGTCAWADGLADDLRALASTMGQARDWDVFLSETCPAIAQAVPDDRRIAQLAAAAGRRRDAAYRAARACLAEADFQRLARRLALLPLLEPWRDGNSALSLRDYAAVALERRLRRMLAAGPSLAELPVEGLHALRKQAKRLRYGTEFFARLFPDKPVRRYLPHLEQLQEELGTINDAAVAAGLMVHLDSGRSGFAVGVVTGFCAAQQQRAIRRVGRSWAAFYRATPFWT